MALGNLSSLRVNLPVIGSVGAVGIAAGLVIVYFMFIRKGRLTSKTITQRFR